MKMKFHEIESSTWEQLQPYLDTCLIPVAGLNGKEHPEEVSKVLERLRDMMDLIEIPYKGRVVTYPAFQYGRESILPLLNDVCRNVKSTGFKYLIVISADVNLEEVKLSEADVLISPKQMDVNNTKTLKNEIDDNIRRIWQGENARQM
jgi:23S rRNA (pseudouridine1915-N3)-methyltransferase